MSGRRMVKAMIWYHLAVGALAAAAAVVFSVHYHSADPLIAFVLVAIAATAALAPVMVLGLKLFPKED